MDEYLEHHGVKGQKWGVRRYQNEDGTLTKAGQRKYSVKTAHKAMKSLNKIDRKRAKLLTKKAISDIKYKKAHNKGKDEKASKFKERSKMASEAIKAGDALTKKLVSDATKKGYTVNSIDRTRYAHTGRQIVGHLLAGPVGNIAVSSLDAYRALTFGSEAGGVVKGTKYRVNRS